MIDLSSNLYQRLQNALSQCKQFESNYALRVVFVDKRISAWHHELEEYTDRIGRVRGTIYQLLQRQSASTKENALVLLLRVLSDSLDPEDALHVELMVLADDLVQELIKVGRQPARVFICYRRYTEPDQPLAYNLYEQLETKGCEVFLDLTMRVGEEWLESIDRHIKESDLFILLLSEHSINSEMVRAEVQRAYEHRKSKGIPSILPIRIQYEGILPYAIQAFIGSLQYITWNGTLDTNRVLSQILAILEGYSPVQQTENFRRSAVRGNISENGSFLLKSQKFSAPSPEFDPRILEVLEEPGGTMHLSDTLYIRRPIDAQMEKQVVGRRTMTTLRAPRQAGKSSLLIRALQYAKNQGIMSVYMDLPAVDISYLQSLDMFLKYLGEFIAQRLSYDSNVVEKHWQGMLGAQDKLSSLLHEILSNINVPIVLAIDEADKLIETPFYNSFFGLLRSWHNRGAYDAPWEKLNMVLVISTSSYLLIRDLKQSPFNIGRNLYLSDFDEKQVSDLNIRHGSPLSDSKISRLCSLLGGHPYLTRKTLYMLVTEECTWATLEKEAESDHGPFGDHLRYCYDLVYDKSELKEGLFQILTQQSCTDEFVFHRLLRAGLVKGEHNECTYRCDLYRRYFEGKLK
ncbi:MAG TPA: AAA-like domain-containing protein [Anaerolineae bacterium]|nr:AAA-like domain-containing protein [Anaerolineae bacterium]